MGGRAVLTVWVLAGAVWCVGRAHRWLIAPAPRPRLRYILPRH